MARLLGIDIGPSEIRGVLLRSAMRRLEVERYLEIPLAEREDSPGRLPELAEAGRNLLAAAGVTPDTIVAAVPGEETSLRSVELPAAARKRIAEILPFELEALLPFEPRDAAIDFQPLAEGESTRLLVAAVLRPKVTAAIEQFRAANLEPHELAAGAAALDGLCQLVPELRAPGPILLVDLGDRRTDLCLLAGGYCIAARTVSIGLSDMPGAAEDARSELHRSLAAFRGAGADEPAAAYACGSGAVAKGGTDWLADVLELPVQPLILPPATQGTREPDAAFGKAAALAARAASSARRRINLRTGEFAPTQVRGQLLGQVNLLVSCAVVIVVAAMFALKARQSLLVSEQDALTGELASVTKQVLGTTITDPALAEAQIKNPKSNDPLPRFDAFDAVGALSSAIPPEISHEVRRLSIDLADEKAEGTFELQGSLESLGQRDEIVSALQKHPCFKEIELGRTNATAGQDRLAYQLEAKLECPGEGPPKKPKTTQSTEAEP